MMLSQLIYMMNTVFRLDKRLSAWKKVISLEVNNLPIGCILAAMLLSQLLNMMNTVFRLKRRLLASKKVISLEVNNLS